MPPKKKKGKGGGKKKKKKDDAQLELEDKYKKTMSEIEALKDQLVVRKEFARRAQMTGDELRQKMTGAEKELEEQQKDQKAINADMTRQYKTMQTEMGLRNHQLETELARIRQHLAQTELELKKTKEEKERMTKEKDEEIGNLQMKINSMEKDYERVIDETLDSLCSKIDTAREKWGEMSTLIQAKNKQVLIEFGLHPLDI
ncbi:hypothetical protein ACJMK2_027087 [Sinanodonta woodiana]|uniref:Dynein regulatory complex protein 12 n=2 Tax=Sinanodonta woodiana TaxID=1069815 RepID=A0ABD3XLN2_SINWO